MCCVSAYAVGEWAVLADCLCYLTCYVPLLRDSLCACARLVGMLPDRSKLQSEWVCWCKVGASVCDRCVGMFRLCLVCGYVGAKVTSLPFGLELGSDSSLLL
jgi:hypothetical protein